MWSAIWQSWKEHIFWSHIKQGKLHRPLPLKLVNPIRPSGHPVHGCLHSPDGSRWYKLYRFFIVFSHKKILQFWDATYHQGEAWHCGVASVPDGQARMLISHATYHQISREGPLDMALRRSAKGRESDISKIWTVPRSTQIYYTCQWTVFRRVGTRIRRDLISPWANSNDSWRGAILQEFVYFTVVFGWLGTCTSFTAPNSHPNPTTLKFEERLYSYLEAMEIAGSCGRMLGSLGWAKSEEKTIGKINIGSAELLEKAMERKSRLVCPKHRGFSQMIRNQVISRRTWC